MQVLKNGEICPKMNDSELWKDIFPQIKEDDWETVEQHLNKKQDNFVVKLRQEDRKSTRLNSSHPTTPRMPSSA